MAHRAPDGLVRAAQTARPANLAVNTKLPRGSRREQTLRGWAGARRGMTERTG